MLWPSPMHVMNIIWIWCMGTSACVSVAIILLLLLLWFYYLPWLIKWKHKSWHQVSPYHNNNDETHTRLHAIVGRIRISATNSNHPTHACSSRICMARSCGRKSQTTKAEKKAERKTKTTEWDYTWVYILIYPYLYIGWDRRSNKRPQ